MYVCILFLQTIRETNIKFPIYSLVGRVLELREEEDMNVADTLSQVIRELSVRRAIHNMAKAASSLSCWYRLCG